MFLWYKITAKKKEMVPATLWVYITRGKFQGRGLRKEQREGDSLSLISSAQQSML